MGGGSVLWAETPDENPDESAEAEAHGDVDESFAARRLQRWIRGMFGGEPTRPAAEDEPGREQESDA
jgi:hypothetical protein